MNEPVLGRPKVLLLAAVLATVGAGGEGTASSLAPPCESCSTGVDTSLIGSAALSSYFGKSLCQVFAAPETLLKAFTIWRFSEPAGVPVNNTGMHLYLTEVDSTGRPDVNRIILDGPTLVLEGNGTDQPRPVTFHFDPPLSLPHQGYFAAAFKEEDPGCARGFGVHIDPTESYPCGKLWQIYKRVDCIGLGLGAVLLTGADLIFQVEFFCPQTPTVRQSWGRFKERYR